ncbi:MAG: DinB family protein [Actinobacteria bacterium]|nr:DinB family protein [Actinomycetota bacterium]
MAGGRTEDWSCEQCGMDFADHRGGGSLAEVTRASAERWRRTTAELSATELRERPDPDTWSVIEYGGHIADVLTWMVDALERMRDEDRPDIAFFSPDRRAEEADYGGRGLAPLTDDINRAVDTLAVLIEDIDERAWGREASFPWGDRDLLDMARNAAHEAVHHTWDAERVASAVSSRD